MPGPPDGYPTAVPVFCTAQIPSETLDTFLTRAVKYAEDWSWRPHIMTPADLLSSEDMWIHSTAPMESFDSPFVGMTPTEVNAVFLEHVAPLDTLTKQLFIILDERSIEEESCLIVHGGTDFDPEDEDYYLRTDFYVCMNMVSRAQLGVTDLGENLERDTVWGVDNLVNF